MKKLWIAVLILSLGLVAEEVQESMDTQLTKETALQGVENIGTNEFFFTKKEIGSCGKKNKENTRDLK